MIANFLHGPPFSSAEAGSLLSRPKNNFDIGDALDAAIFQDQKKNSRAIMQGLTSRGLFVNIKNYS